MKIISPPKLDFKFNKIYLEKIIKQNISPTITHQNQYLHWDKLKHLNYPNSFNSIEEYWFFIKFSRIGKYEKLPFIENFVYILTDEVQKNLHEIDSLMHGALDKNIPNDTKKYIKRSLIEEAITSSQMEGASTTRIVAKNMLQKNTTPKDKSEQMIYNNYQAIKFILDYKNDTITSSFILELHKIITKEILDNPNDSGTIRQNNDINVVDNRDNKILHQPPEYKELLDRMKVLVNFINNKLDNKFIHPVLRAIITHFILAYDHPFVDGNGRTARALFYLVLMKHNYWLFQYISISHYMYKAPAKYGKSFLEVETDSFDLTYFIISQLRFIKQAITDLFKYIDEEEQKTKDAVKIVNNYISNSKLNLRQGLLLKDAMSNGGKIYTISEHKIQHGIGYETAKRDLLKLSRLKLLEQSKRSREFIFIAPNDLKQRIEKGN